MGHHNHAQPHGPAEFSKQGKNRLTAPGIQVTGGFVGQKQGRFQHQGPGQGNPLLLAAGELARTMIKPMGQANPVKQVSGAMTYSLFRLATDPAGHHDIFQGGKFRQKMVKLKDKTDVMVTMAGQLLFRQAEQGLACKEKLALVRRIQGAEDLQQGGFSGSGCADYGAHLTWAGIQINAAQHLHPAWTLTKPLPDAPGCQQRILIHS